MTVKSSLEEIRDLFKQLVTNEKFVFLLLKDNDNGLGYAWIEFRIYLQNAFMKQRKSVFVHQISIVEDQTRQGYGTRLMNYICDLAKDKGIDVVELDYWTDNSNAKNFYKKQGFVGYRKFVYRKL